MRASRLLRRLGAVMCICAVTLAIAAAFSWPPRWAIADRAISQSFSMTAPGQGPSLTLTGGAYSTCNLTLYNPSSGNIVLVPQASSDNGATLTTASTIGGGSITGPGVYTGNIAGTVAPTTFTFTITSLTGIASGVMTCSSAVGLASGGGGGGATPIPYPTDASGVIYTHPTELPTINVNVVGATPTPLATASPNILVTIPQGESAPGTYSVFPLCGLYKVFLSNSTSTSVVTLTGAAGESIHVCSLVVQVSAATTVALGHETTGSSCATVTTDFTYVFTAANLGAVENFGASGFTLPSGDDECVTASTNGGSTVWETYALY